MTAKVIFFIDRCLGRVKVPESLRNQNLRITDINSRGNS
ncbi:hypothetical protein PL10110_170096 [Planktothrix agardhii]|nr:hypothetical protein PL10110_170096 [Planktothrix agardhii]